MFTLKTVLRAGGAALTFLTLLSPVVQAADAPAIPAYVKADAKALEAKIIAWRRDIHQHPELGNREVRTAKLVADHLKKLGLEVQTGVAHTGVVAVLRGGKPGPVVALRADMDALPVTEQVDVPFASKVRTNYNGQDVGVMHACGHDGHVAILMGVAELLAKRRADLPGTVKFIFQPAEEGAPEGEEGGAELMVKQGVLDTEPKPQAIFGLHLGSSYHAGTIAYRPGPAMAAADTFKIVVQGRQAHGGRPWTGVDPLVTSAQILVGLQTIVSRNMEVIKEPAVVTVGALNGGVRSNIIPDKAEMVGTIRTFDQGMRQEVHERIRRVAENIAESAGAKATVTIETGYPVTDNDRSLTTWAAPVLAQVAGPGKLVEGNKTTGAEDFSFFQQKIPGFFFWVGATPPDVPLDKAPSNHSPLFKVDESSLVQGAEAMASLTVAWLSSH
ncbi:amidohydrolase [Niveispirillum cyanobacteriorum]|uniref:Amidohydrolase n=1 Tax=Niveispirillum cyanobacteriorum TaxID=1612173 RepID=A0A2K9NFN0_9PROT|nr:amidohydrolase [Niveispirillum cyanobacteriorum]AUN31356.1 amidohydrolase [Niveispirillum cyanobacteriorum]GGE71910.1 N-acyl-L-amino acid amidohydrolase [Niveispirillum cyanobacteriorum]